MAATDGVSKELTMATNWIPNHLRTRRAGAKPGRCDAAAETKGECVRCLISEEVEPAPSVWQEFRNSARRMLLDLLHAPDRYYAWDYFMLVITERNGLDPATVDPQSCACARCDQLIRRLYRKYQPIRHKLSIQEVWQVDLALMQMLPELALRAKAVSIRDGYRKIVGESDPLNDGAAAHIDIANDNGNQLRAELTDLMRGKYWYQLNAMLLERGFRALKFLLVCYAWVGLFAVVTLSLLAWKLVGGDLGQAIGVVMATAYAGVLGAVISAARRTKSFNDIANSHSDPVVRLTRIENGKTGMHLSMITGGVFAVVLYLFFLAGIGQSVLLPGFLPTFRPPSSQLPLGLIPAGATDLSRLMLWAFAAGFAEKLVPDVLDRFSKLPDREPNPPEPPRDRDRRSGPGGNSKLTMKQSGSGSPHP
jgi:hypothetical protein